jgi:hypothetical protein
LVVSLADSPDAYPFLVGDVNGDYKVDGKDLKSLTDYWLDPGCIAPACEADLDGVPGVSMFIQDPNGDYHDWIEIYNYGANTIDIGGMYLTDDVNDSNQWYRIPDNCPEKTTIGPSGYLLIWADSELSEDGLHVDFGLDAGGEEDVGLIDVDGITLIDSIIDFPALGGDNSYGRFPNGSGPWSVFVHDTNTPPTPGEFNGGESGTNIVINEIMYHPYHRLYDPYYEPEDIRAEYIELFNRGTELVNLSGWKITDGVDFSFPNDVTIDVGGYLVVAADMNTFTVNYPGVTNVVGGWDGRLSNSGEEIELIDDLRVNIDRVRYADEGDWAVREEGPLDNNHRGWVWYDEHDGGGKSLELVNPGLPNQYGQNWAASLNNGGTPGVGNSVADNDTAPMILDAKHRPRIPGPGDPVIVTADIIDELTTGIVITLHYRVDGALPVFTSLTMFDDATHGDEDANDGVYTARIPAYSDGTIIEFYIEASDAGANSRTWPAPALVGGVPQQVTNLLYQVNDSYDPNAKWVPGSQPIYYLIMTDAEWTELEYIGSHNPDAQTYAQMHATFISVDGVDTKLRYNVGVRNRGHGSRNDPPNNYRVNFRNDDSWKGVTAINLNTKYTYLQLVGNAIFRVSGLAQSETTAVQVRVNGQNLAVSNDEMYGSYVHVEVVDNDFANKHYPDDEDGNAYKCMRKTHQADLRYEGTIPNPYRGNYFKRTNVAEDDWSDLIDLTYALSNNTPDGIYVEEVNRVLNVEQWLRLIAVNTLLGNNETTLANGNGDDYYLYRGIVDPRFVLIQHDMDCIFGIGDNPDSGAATRSIFRATAIPAMKRFMEHPQFVPRYYWHLRDLIETTFSPESFGSFIDKLLGDYVPASKIDQIKNFIPARNAHVLSVIESELTINPNLAQSYGYYETNVDFAALDGTADAVETRSVLVNGQLADWSAFDGAWSIGASAGGVIKEITLVAENTGKKALVPTGPVDPNWRSNPMFDDSGWNHGTPTIPGTTGGVGYERGTGYENYITYDVEAEMRGNNATCYVRIPFTLDPCDLAGLNYMTLKMRYDDGFVAYINGNKVKGISDPSPLLWDSETANNGSHEAGAGFVEYPINSHISALQPGNNVLAIHGLNVSPTSSDFIISAELVAGIMGQASDGIALNPGINRVIVQTFDGPSGTGSELEREFVDIWYNTGSTDDYPKEATSWSTNLIVRDSYLPGVPVLVRVKVVGDSNSIKHELWDATATLSVYDNPTINLSTNQVTMYNGLGSALVTFTGSGDFTLLVDVNGLQATAGLTDWSGQTINTASGTLSSSQTWSGIYHITGGDYSIPAGVTLTLNPGTLVLIDGVSSGTSGTDIDVAGSIQSLGTATSPVTFTAYTAGNNWGELHHVNAQPSTFQYTNITQAGHSPAVGHSNTGPTIRVSNSTFVFDYASLTDNAGKLMHVTSVSDLTFRHCLFARSVMGPEMSGTALLFEDSWITDMHAGDDADGIYIHGQQPGQLCTLIRGVAANIVDDGVDTLSSEVTVEDF